jgi:hypothetical protein
MKGTVLIVLVAVLVAALSPVRVLTVPVVSTKSASLSCLDVCRSHAPAISSNGSAPCICSCSVTVVPVIETAMLDPQAPFFSELILSASDDHPPRA